MTVHALHGMYGLAKVSHAVLLVFTVYAVSFETTCGAMPNSLSITRAWIAAPRTIWNCLCHSHNWSQSSESTDTPER